jgi:alpha-tubulin suppressor-like RCC1 family protein
MGDNLPAVNLGTRRHAVSVSAGAYHTCAVLDNASIKCWGYNYDGKLGAGLGAYASYRGVYPSEMGDNLSAVNLGTNRTAAAVATGAYHSCAVLDNGSVKCWGSNRDGALGIGTAQTYLGVNSYEMGDALPAVQLGSGRTAVQVVGMNQGTCALLDNGSVKCWGNNDYGQLGLGSTRPGAPPPHTWVTPYPPYRSAQAVPPSASQPACTTSVQF